MRIILIAALLWGAFSVSPTYAVTISGSENISHIYYGDSEVNISSLRMRTVVVLQGETKDGKEVAYHSAGIAVDKRHILTVFHAVSDSVYKPEGSSDFVNYYVPSVGHKAYYLTIERYDSSHDLALLKIDNEAPDLIAEPLIFAPIIKVGEVIFTIGHTVGAFDLTTGTIQGFHASGWDGIDSTELYAPIRAGNSGGGVIDEYGNLVGMVFSAFENIDNLGFMISAEDMQNFLK